MLREAGMALQTTRTCPAQLIARHGRGEWGTVGEENWQTNDRALKEGTSLVSAYALPTGQRIWIITEWDHCATTILLPSEY